MTDQVVGRVEFGQTSTAMQIELPGRLTRLLREIVEAADFEFPGWDQFDVLEEKIDEAREFLKNA